MEKPENTGRLFLGIPLTDEARKKVKKAIWQGLSKYKNDNLVPAINWHFTLAFVGNTSQETLQKLERMLSNEDWGKPFKMSIRGYGAFPDMESGRILYAGVKRGEEEITNLALHIRKRLEEIQIEYDDKPFVPHMTVCRLKRSRNLMKLHEDGKMKQETVFPVDHFILYQSSPDNQSYEEITKIYLK